MAGTLSSTAAKQGLDGITNGAVWIDLYENTTLLIRFPVVFGAATTALPSVSTIQNLPVSATAVGTGNANVAKIVTNSGDVRWELSGSDAIGLTGQTGYFITVTNKSFATGQSGNLTGGYLSLSGVISTAS